MGGFARRQGGQRRGARERDGRNVVGAELGFEEHHEAVEAVGGGEVGVEVVRGEGGGFLGRRAVGVGVFVGGA